MIPGGASDRTASSTRNRPTCRTCRRGGPRRPFPGAGPPLTLAGGPRARRSEAGNWPTGGAADDAARLRSRSGIDAKVEADSAARPPGRSSRVFVASSTSAIRRAVLGASWTAGGESASTASTARRMPSRARSSDTSRRTARTSSARPATPDVRRRPPSAYAIGLRRHVERLSGLGGVPDNCCRKRSAWRRRADRRPRPRNAFGLQYPRSTVRPGNFHSPNRQSIGRAEPRSRDAGTLFRWRRLIPPGSGPSPAACARRGA